MMKQNWGKNNQSNAPKQQEQKQQNQQQQQQQEPAVDKFVQKYGVTEKQMEQKYKFFIDSLGQQLRFGGFEFFEDNQTLNESITKDNFLKVLIQLMEKNDDSQNKDITLCTNYLFEKNKLDQGGALPLATLSTLLNIKPKLRQQLDEMKQMQNQQNLQQGLGIQNKKAKQKESKQINYDKEKAEQTKNNIKQKLTTNKALMEHFYPTNGNPVIEITYFIQRVQDLNDQIQEDEATNLFHYIDVNQGGSISYSEFKLVFIDNQKDNISSKANATLSPQMEKEIQELFLEVDKDKSGFLEFDELKVLFSNIGVNLGPEELKSYIKRFDKDNNGKISFDEFHVIMEEKLKSEILSASNLIDDLRVEFKRADTKGLRLLKVDQVGQVFKNMKIQLRQEELAGLFNEIDMDQSGYVDIDEMIYFISKDQQNSSSLAAAAVLNICSSSKLGISDLRNAFIGMPSNFRTSFIRANLKKKMNWPSSLLQPRLSTSQTYQDLYLINTFQDLNESILDRGMYLDSKEKAKNQQSSTVYIEVKLDYALGVPIPEEKLIPRENLIHREFYICLYDQSKNSFIGNTIRIPAQLDRDDKQKWIMMNSKMKDYNCFYIKINNFSPQKDSKLNICLEANLHYLPKNQKKDQKQTGKEDIELSCCYGLVPIITLLQFGSRSVNMEGGEPTKPIVINQEEIRKKTVGFFGGETFAEVKSTLVISSSQVDQNLIQNNLCIMPSNMLMNKNALPYVTAYREFLAFKAFGNHNLNLTLQNDYQFINLCRIFDSPEAFEYVYRFWAEEVIPFLEKQQIKSLEKQYGFMEAIACQFYLVFQSTQYRISNNDPTSSCECFDLKRSRDQLVRSGIDDLRIKFKIKQGQSKPISDNNPQPFNVMEVIGNDDEDDIKMIDQWLQKKMGIDLKTKKIE